MIALHHIEESENCRRAISPTIWSQVMTDQWTISSASTANAVSVGINLEADFFSNGCRYSILMDHKEDGLGPHVRLRCINVPVVFSIL